MNQFTSNNSNQPNTEAKDSFTRSKSPIKSLIKSPKDIKPEVTIKKVLAVFLTLVILSGVIYFVTLFNQKNKTTTTQESQITQNRDLNTLQNTKTIKEESYPQEFVNILQKPPINPNTKIQPKNLKDYKLSETKENYNPRFNNFVAQKTYTNPAKNIEIVILNKTQNQETRQQEYWNKLDQFLLDQGELTGENGQNLIQKIFYSQIPDTQKTYLLNVEISKIKNLQWDTDVLRVFVTLDGANIDGEPVINFVGRKGFEYFAISSKVGIGAGIVDAIRDECGVAGSDYTQFNLKCYQNSIKNSTIIQEAITKSTNIVVESSELI
jgi:hypothetical protein